MDTSDTSQSSGDYGCTSSPHPLACPSPNALTGAATDERRTCPGMIHHSRLNGPARFLTAYDH